MRPARSMSRWLTTSASAGTSLRFWIGYADRRMQGFPQPGRSVSPVPKRGILGAASRPCHASRMKVDFNEIRMRRGIFLLPNLLTTCCLFGGFYAIVASIDGNFERATIAIFVAMIFDGLDGRVARLMGTETAFGKEFDSLADMVAFGIAPAVVCYQWGVERIAEYGSAWGRFGWIAAFFYRRRGRTAARAIQCALGDTGQALLRGPAEPVGRRDRRRIRRARARVRRHRAPGPRARLRHHAARRGADGQQVSIPQLQGPRDRRARALLEAPAGAARDRADRDQSAGRPLRRCSAIYALSGPIGWSWLKLRRRPRDGGAAGTAAERDAGAATRGPRCARASTPTCRARRAASARAAPPTGRSAGTSSPAPCANAGCAASARRARRRYSAPATASARLMVVGEAPGAEEDRQGEPFVGRAGHAAQLDAAGGGIRAGRSLHRERPEVPAAEQPRPKRRGGRALPAIPAPADRARRAGRDPLRRPHRCATAARHRPAARRACAAACTTSTACP